MCQPGLVTGGSLCRTAKRPRFTSRQSGQQTWPSSGVRSPPRPPLRDCPRAGRSQPRGNKCTAPQRGRRGQRQSVHRDQRVVGRGQHGASIGAARGPGRALRSNTQMTNSVLTATCETLSKHEGSCRARIRTRCASTQARAGVPRAHASYSIRRQRGDQHREDRGLQHALALALLGLRSPTRADEMNPPRTAGQRLSRRVRDEHTRRYLRSLRMTAPLTPAGK